MRSEASKRNVSFEQRLLQDLGLSAHEWGGSGSGRSRGSATGTRRPPPPTSTPCSGLRRNRIISRTSGRSENAPTISPPPITPPVCPSIAGNGNVSVAVPVSFGVLEERSRERREQVEPAAAEVSPSSDPALRRSSVSAAAVGSADRPNRPRRRHRRTARKRARIWRAIERQLVERPVVVRLGAVDGEHEVLDPVGGRPPARRLRTPSPCTTGFRRRPSDDQLSPISSSHVVGDRVAGTHGARAFGYQTNPFTFSRRERAEEMTALGRPGPVSADGARARRGTDSDRP